MNFQGYLENAYRIIKAEPFILILGGLLIQLLNSVTLSILYGPLFGGYLLLVILLLRDDKKPAFNDLFNGFQAFRLLIPYFFILLAKIIGFMLFIVPGVLFATWWIYVLPLMIDRKIGFGKAMRISSDKVTEAGFFMHMVFFLLVYVIPVIVLEMLSSFMPFLMVLTLLLMPFQVGCLVSLYLDQFKEQELATAPEKQHESAEATPMIPPPTEIIESSVEEETESPQTGQSVSKVPETSEQPTDVSMPEGNDLEEKPDQGTDADQHQEDEGSDKDTEKDDKDNN
ncbi:MAG: hypothetical protein IME97_07020 [Proteobacteria bacterium]|nr:hypothetical protein [Pseudomonadota bacterium]